MSPNSPELVRMHLHCWRQAAGLGAHLSGYTPFDVHARNALTAAGATARDSAVEVDGDLFWLDGNAIVHEPADASHPEGGES